MSLVKRRGEPLDRSTPRDIWSLDSSLLNQLPTKGEKHIGSERVPKKHSDLASDHKGDWNRWIKLVYAMDIDASTSVLVMML